MKLTCAQMDVLISFYLEGELSSNLKTQVEEHMKNCAGCRTKFEIIKSMLKDLKNSLDIDDEVQLKKNDEYKTKTTSSQYRIFKNNLSAYIDNELNSDENIKIKKFTINNENAKQELQDNYNIKKLLSDSFRKTQNEARHDFSRSVLRQLELEEEANLGIHPVIQILIGFTIVVLILTAIVLSYLSV